MAIRGSRPCIMAALLLTLVSSIAFGRSSKRHHASRFALTHISTGSSDAHHSVSVSKKHRSGTGHHGPNALPGLRRDKHGKIKRSAKAEDTFKKSHPCTSTGKGSGPCPGYVVDDVVPLKRGGRMTRATCSGRQSTPRKRRIAGNVEMAAYQRHGCQGQRQWGSPQPIDKGIPSEVRSSER